MADTRGGTAVAKPPAGAGRVERSLYVRFLPGQASFLIGEVGYCPLDPSSLNRLDEARRASVEFAKTLYRLSQSYENKPKIKALSEDLPCYDEPSSKNPLTLSKKEARAVLNNLQTVGLIRDKLPENLVAKLTESDFLQTNASPTMPERKITFVDPHQSPVLWDMMYEGDSLESPHWEHFWGFRAPISHWLWQPREGAIHMPQGLFTAHHQELPFSGHEVAALLRMIMHCEPASLEASLRMQAEKVVLAQSDNDHDQAKAWWQSVSPKLWMNQFLSLKLPVEDEELRSDEGKKWLVKEAINILQVGLQHDLVHFACHCEDRANTSLLTELEMMIGGSKLELVLARLEKALARSFKPEDPGPLVFLNACDTSKPRPNLAPPALPDFWINVQGALALISTICPVPDIFAYAFARKFYELLFEALKSQGNPGQTNGSAIAEIFRQTRVHFMQVHNNPLGLAYILYAPGDLAVVPGELSNRGGA